MASLNDFGDFMKSTAPAWASSQEAFVNELQERNYPLARFLKGRDTSETFQNGERIKDGIILDAAGTFQMIDPETESVWTNTQTLSEWQIPWRFAQCHMTWTAQEVELNEGSSAAVWKRVKKIKQTGLANDIVNGMNAKLFAAPQKSKMESFTAAPGEPQSIPALVNEYANGLWGISGVGDNYVGSTVQGISPSTKTRWQPVKKTYANFDAAPAGGTTNLLMAFDDIFLDLQFRQPGTMNEYFESTDMFRQVIYCTKDGIVKYKKILRDANDVQVTPSRQDPAYVNATYAGIPLERAPQLETELLYAESGASVYNNETASANNHFSGPRYYWINANYMKMAFHSNYYFKYLDVFSPERNRTKYVMPIQTWFNLYVTSRRHHGIVCPSADA